MMPAIVTSYAGFDQASDQLRDIWYIFARGAYSRSDALPLITKIYFVRMVSRSRSFFVT